MGANKRHFRSKFLQALEIIVFAALFLCAFFPQITHAQNPDAGDVTTGLIGHWKLDETSGTQITDSSLNANHGTWTDNENSDLAEETNSNGKVSNSIIFDTDDRITIPTIADYNVGTTGSFSISFWFKTNDPSIGMLSAGGGNQIIAMDMDAGRIRFRMRDSLGNSLFFPYNCPYGCRNDNEWHLAVMVLDRINNSAHVYIDDVEEQSFSDVSAATGNMGAIVQINTNSASSGLELDDIRYYNRALSIDDVALLYRSFPGVMPCNASYEAVMIFNADEGVMQYCNGTDWINMGEGKTCGTALCGESNTERLVFSTTAATPTTLADFDNDCQNRADSVGLQGTYLAWAADGDPASAPASRFSIAGTDLPIKTVNGTIIADNWADLTDGTLYTPINTQADGKVGVVINTTATNVNTDGTQYSTTSHCFTGGSGSTHSGVAYFNDSRWTDQGPGYPCGLGRSIYCFEQGPPASPTGCTSPTGKAGEMTYNLDEGVMQYCNGTNWIAMGPKIQDAGSSADDLSPSAPTNGLVAHWRLDETAGPTAVDSIGSYNGTYLNSPTPFAAGKFGYALDFDIADSDGVEITGTQFGQPANITIAGWVDIDSLDSSGATLVNLVGKVRIEFMTTYTEGSFESTGIVQNRTQYMTPLTGTGWRHVAYTMDDTNNIQTLYVDGTAVASDTYSTSIDWGANTTSRIGRYWNNFSNWDMDGRIDDVRLYNRALSDDEVTALYRSSSLVGHWKLDETTGTTAADSSGNGNDGTVSGTDFDTDSVAAVSGSGLQFDGIDDEIEVPTSPSLQPADALTLASWVKFETFNSDANVIIAKQVGTGGNEYYNSYTILYDHNTNELKGYAGGGGGFTGLATSFTPALNTWYHVAYTYNDAANNHKLYLDGAEIASGTNNSLLGYNTSPVTFGFDYEDEALTNNDWHFGSVLDDIRIYNRDLSATEIAQLYSVSGGGSVSLQDSSCPNIGDVCADGSFYAGQHPVDGEHLYITASDESNSTPWSNLTVDLGINNIYDGRINQQWIVDNATLSDYPAFELCENLNRHGKDDWYLPAIDELDTVYTNLRISPADGDTDNPASGCNGGNFDPATETGPQSGTFSGTTYQSSTESSSIWSCGIGFGSGRHFGNRGKTATTFHTRCMRRGASTLGTCSSPRGIAGEMIYNDDHTIMQYCNGSEWVGIGDSN